MPVEYITGECDFRGIKLKMESPIFIPMSTTVKLVDLVLDEISRNQNDKKSTKTFNILEIGCGSGAISLSILNSCGSCKILAIDANPNACKLARKNADTLGFGEDRLKILNARLQKNGTFLITQKEASGHSDLEDADKFDIIVSNPPYMPTKLLIRVPPEIIQ